MSAEPGRLSLNRTPYLRGILDAAIDPQVEEIVFVAGTQVGKTTLQEILLGYWIDVDPGPCLVVKPSEESASEYIKERIRPILAASPVLAAHLSDRPTDNTLSSIKLDSMPIYFGWAGSPQSLASRPCRYVLPDEVDKYPPFSGREADPVSLARERTATFRHRRRVILSSTPTVRTGAIWTAYEGCGDKRWYWVPCSHCGEYQRLIWAQVKWPRINEQDKIKRADIIEQDRLAWYECQTCKARIEDSRKPKMLEAGNWVSEGREIDRSGRISGDRVASKRVGFHLSSLYSPWRTFAEMAGEFIRAEGDLPATMNFRNSRLAEPFEERGSSREPTLVRQKSEAAKNFGRAGMHRVVPSWAVLLLATADVQKDHIYWIVTAWGYGQKSKRIAVGVSPTLEDSYSQVFSPSIDFTAETGGVVYVQTITYDAKYRKDEVTKFAQSDPNRIHLSQGNPHYFGPIAEQKIEKASGVVIWKINTMQSKDTLHRLMTDPNDPTHWQAYPNIGDEYCSHMASEHKIIDPQKKTWTWVPKTSGQPNHWWDCEANATAIATAMGAALPLPAEAKPQPIPAEPEKNDRDWGERPSNWMDG